jgi:hypothetical protein
MVNLMIGFGLCFEYYLERINHKEHGLRHHAVFSLAVSGVAFIAWILEIASFWSPSQVLATAGFINLVFVACLCAWCLWLAIRIFPNFDVNAVQQMDYI